MCEPAMAVGGKLQRMDRHSSHASYIDFAVEPMHVRLSAVNVTVTVEPGFYSSVSSEVICGTGDDVPQMVKEAEVCLLLLRGGSTIPHLGRCGINDSTDN